MTVSTLQKQPSGIMPSGEGNFYDFNQSHIYYASDSGINSEYPHPSNFIDGGSGLLQTYPPNGVDNLIDQSGILAYNLLTSRFSNAKVAEFPDLALYNNYIHYHPEEPYSIRTVAGVKISTTGPFYIPFVSSYREAETVYDPYGRIV